MNTILPWTDVDKWEAYIDKQEWRTWYQNWWYDGFNMMDDLFKKLRAWYLMRWVPLIFCETVWEHCLRLERTCDAVLEWTPERVENPIRFKWMARYHDLPEYPPEVPDITPYCNFTKLDKKTIELWVIQRVKLILWPKWSEVVSLLEEYSDHKTNDSKEITFHDKILAWVWWLEYEKIGFKDKMADFHPRILWILEKDAYLKNIYEILLEREFWSIDYFVQYYMLLQLAWDYEKYREMMIWFTKNINI